MKKSRSTSAEAAELRRRAEDRLQAATMRGPAPIKAADTQRLVHELQVHQIELEMQSEELWQSRAEAEAGLEHYIELLRICPGGILDPRPRRDDPKSEFCRCRAAEGRPLGVGGVAI